MKKAFAVMLSALFAVSMCLIPPASADSEPLFLVSSANALPGGSADVEIIIKNSPGIASAKLTVTYDEDLTLESVTFNEELGEMCGTSVSLRSPLILNWIALSDVSGDTLFATLRFTVPDEMPLGEKAVNIGFDPEDICDADEKNVDFGIAGGAVRVVSCLHGNTEIRDKSDPRRARAGYTGDTYCLDCGEKIAEGEYIFVPGDANTDGAVDIRDIVRIGKYLGDGTVEISEYADADGDGSVVFADFLRVCDIILG